MRNNGLVKTLSTLAIADTLSLALILYGAGNCIGGDGCLFFSLLFVVALGCGLVILLLSLIAWVFTRKSSAVPRYFYISNLALFALTTVTAAATILTIR